MQQIHTRDFTGYIGHKHNLIARINPFYIGMRRQPVDRGWRHYAGGKIAGNSRYMHRCISGYRLRIGPRSKFYDGMQIVVACAT